MSLNVLEVEGLCKSFGKKQVLTDVSLIVKENEILGFIGPNGAGKSTTMKCICNLIFPNEGTIRINGFDLKKERAKALNSQAALIESPGLFMDMSGRENINLIGSLKKVSKTQLKKIYDFTDLKEALEKKVGTYSMGMKQRLALGIAILNNPKLLLLDEPTNGLDPTAVIKLRTVLKELVSEYKISILLSSHQLGELEKVANRMICINNGRIVDTPSYSLENTAYLFKVSDINKLLKSLGDFNMGCRLSRVDQNTLRVELNERDLLDPLLLKIHEQHVRILDIAKEVVDVEKMYMEVYG